MKCSEYLWKRIEMDTNAPDDWSPERVQGEMNLLLNGEPIVSDLNGEIMSERDANSVYGRNYDALNKAYAARDRDLFNVICMKQLVADFEYHQQKK